MAAATTKRIFAAAALGAALAAVPSASAQTMPRVRLAGVASGAVFEALATECYDARMVADVSSDSIMDCSAVLEERSSGAASGDPNEVVDTVVIRHKIRFTLLERADESSIAADAWTEIEELGTVIEEPIAGAQYLQRVADVLRDVAARLSAPADAAPPWAGRYESEQAWHLDAHLRSVSHCDTNLASMTAESVGGQLESIGILPLDDDTRSRCEQLFQHLFEWSLARGNAAPTVAAYAAYREALPPEERVCLGRLALEMTCG